LRGNCLELSPDLLLTGDGEPVGAMNWDNWVSQPHDNDWNSRYCTLKMLIFHSYVSLPEGILCIVITDNQINLIVITADIRRFNHPGYVVYFLMRIYCSWLMVTKIRDSWVVDSYLYLFILNVASMYAMIHSSC
jgi:hypothetical protein